MWDLETERVIDEIKNRNARLVLFQAPEGLKRAVEQEIEKIKKQVSAELVIWGETCFGACDLCDEEIKMLGADLVVHYGHEPLPYVNPSIPTVFVHAYYSKEDENIVKNVEEILKDMDGEVIERQAKEGVDFMTLHCGITKQSVESLTKDKRIMGVVSRGGAFLTAYILHNQKENPLYENFDYLLEILYEHDVTLSLGDGMRPGCLPDNTDRPQIHELIVLGELVDRCREAGVQVMVEGPGHVPLNNIEANMKIQKTLCKNAPFYVLGPIVSDLAPGYDHITSAIGGAIAAYSGANFLCYVTPSEHVRIMKEEDVKEGLVASKIAAQAADVARGNSLAWEKEVEMAYARKNHDWEKQFELAIDKEKPKKMREEIPSSDEKACSICGKYCALLMVEELGKR